MKSNKMKSKSKSTAVAVVEQTGAVRDTYQISRVSVIQYLKRSFS